MRSARSRAERLLVLMAASVLGAGLAAAPSQAAEGDPVITWPSMTALNPESITYEVLTTGADPATDRFRVTNPSPGGTTVTTPVESDGSTVVAFPDFTDHQQVVVLLQRCAPTCVTIGRSENVQLYNRIFASAAYPERVGPSYGAPGLRFWVQEGVEPLVVRAVEYQWELHASDSSPDDAPLASGQTDGFGPLVGPSLSDVQVPDSTYGHDYVLRLRLVADTEWGLLEGETTNVIYWDSKHDFTVKKYGPSLIYPVKDGFRDHVEFGVDYEGERDPVRDLDLTAYDSSGEQVSRLVDPSPSGGWGYSLVWDGRDFDGNVVPEGKYDIVLTSTDTAGNSDEWRTTIEVSRMKKKRLEWSQTVRAADVLVDQHVGRCASLKKPARRGWRGSIGFRSQSDCRKPEQSVVQSLHELEIPYSYFGSYWLRVSAFGGTAKGSRPSRIALSYRNRKDGWSGGGTLGGAVRLHHGWQQDEGVVLGQEQKDTRLVWALGLGGGYNYDVKYFTVEVTTTVLTY